MRITERGQLTIPKKLRLRYGITPTTDMDFRETQEGILVVKRSEDSRFERFRGIANAPKLPKRTDDLLSLLRDEP